jgi:alginate O-acetyltransferase complex protein AlgI
MLFCSLPFCLFFAIVFTLHWSLPWHRGRVYLLLAASFYFYASWNRWLALVLCVSTMADYLLALGMESFSSVRLRRFFLLLSLAGNLSLLCYFKYANFFLRSVEDASAGLGFSVALPILNVILPVGISFYTFEAINYTVDVYLRRIRAERNLAHFMLFILFFPHLVAGPIVRARDFLPLVGRRKHWSWLRANTGVLLILMGLVKKLAVADRLALYVDPVFADPSWFSSFAIWLAAIAYTLQIYCDFSGYTDMALGLAHLFGYHLAQNFNMPFLSANMAELWRRWHISLSTWIRDYLFIPLGGSRGSRWRTGCNLLVSMTLCGLWHGARWNFVIWGLANGFLLVLHLTFSSWCRRHAALDAWLRSAPGTALRVATTFASFCSMMVIFRTQSLAAAGTALWRMLVPTGGAGLTMQLHGLWITFAFVALCHALGYRNRWLRLWEQIPLPVRGLGFGTALTLALLLAPGATKAFIYFQF